MKAPKVDCMNMSMRRIAMNVLFALAITFMVICTPKAARASIAFVQVNSVTPQSSVSTVTVAYPAAQTAGNLNIVVVGWNDSTSTGSSLSDSRGNVYVQAGPTQTGTALRQAIYYAKNIAGGSNSVTVNFNQAATFIDVRVLEYSGLDVTNPLDATASAAGSCTSPNSGSATTTSTSELIFGAGTTGGTFSGAGTGFTSRRITQDGDIAEDKVVSSIGNYSASAPLPCAPWVMQMATFRTSVSVSISPTSASVQVSHTQQFTATVTGTVNTAVNWQVNNVTGGNSTVGTVSSSGLYAAPAAVPNPPTVTVKAISQADPTKSASATVTITSGAATTFPRLAGMLIGNPHNYDQSSYQHQIAKLDLAVLGMYAGWNPNGTTPAQAVNQIHALNPSILLANYTIMTETPNDGSGDTSTGYKRTKIESQVGPNGRGDWWAYDASGNHTDETGGNGTNIWDNNITLFVAPDANGYHLPEWLAHSDYQYVLQGVNFNFWYSDNNYWKPRSAADWQRTGVNDDPNNPTVQNWYRDGQRAYYTTAASVAPNLPLMVNADNDLDGSVYPGGQSYTQYKNVVGGAYLEHAIGKDWSVETWGSWSLMMGWYHHIFSNLLSPQMVILDAYCSNTADYQTLRYSFGSALMDNGYFSASTDYNQILWFDEFDLAGTSTTKWLGQAVDGPQTSPWSNGVYRRRFQNGIVLVNPKGNGQQTVSIGTGYKHFLGNQAPTINNGQVVTSVTLKDRDGIFLVNQ